MYIDYLTSPVGTFQIEATDSALVGIEPVKALNKPKGNRITEACKKQLEEYFMGQRRRFDLPLQLNGTDFQKAVWLELGKIEYGSTRSYSEIATLVGRPRAYRAVGMANGQNRLPIILPCHRVIGKQNKLVGYALGLEMKSWLLKHEMR